MASLDEVLTNGFEKYIDYELRQEFGPENPNPPPQSQQPIVTGSAGKAVAGVDNRLLIGGVLALLVVVGLAFAVKG